MEISTKEFIRIVKELAVGDTLDFYGSEDDPGDFKEAFGLVKLELFDAVTIIGNSYGGNALMAIDTGSTDYTVEEALLEYLENIHCESGVYFSEEDAWFKNTLKRMTGYIAKNAEDPGSEKNILNFEFSRLNDLFRTNITADNGAAELLAAVLRERSDVEDVEVFGNGIIVSLHPQEETQVQNEPVSDSSRLTSPPPFEIVRANVLLDRTLDWIAECHQESDELYVFLKDRLKMADEEIERAGFDLEQFRDPDEDEDAEMKLE